MEYRIKTQKVGRICSKSSERVVDWALECVLDETEAAKLTEVDMDYILGGRKAHQYAHVEYKGSDDNQVMPNFSELHKFNTDMVSP